MTVKRESGRKKATATAAEGLQTVRAHHHMVGVQVAHIKKTSAESSRTYLVRDVLGAKKPVTVKMIRDGLSPLVIIRLSKRLDISTECTLKFVNLSKQTYARRQKTGKLTAEESDRVWRVADLIARASQLLGDEIAAAEWLRTPAPALDGEAPLERASTEIGARDVEQLIGRLEHGIAT